MRRRPVTACLTLAWAAWLAAAAFADERALEPHRFNRAPLRPKAFAELPIGAVRPEGWLRDQLERMAKGMTGRLDELYPEVVGPRNGWLGGDGDGWERGPYWIDGLLPLAHLLEDEALLAKARPWIEWMLENQREDGYFGPVPFDTPPPPERGLQKTPRRDWWPKMVMLKVLMTHYSATGDERVPRVLDRYFRYQLRELPRTPLGHWTFWGQRRGGDNLLVVLWLYNLTGERHLLELAEIIHEQTYPHTEEWSKVDSPLTRRLGMHCVNIAQGFKHPIVAWQMDGEPRHLAAVDKAFADLERSFGLPTGLYGADEPLNSAAPTTGSEFCTAVEMMYSLEKMLEITGDLRFADRLERVAYNVLPTQARDDYSGKQYYSLVNQVVCGRRVGAHLTDHAGTDNVYGVLTGYPCCTTNLHQGWPKLVQHLFLESRDGGLAALVYGPCRVSARVGEGVSITIRERTGYPFEGRVLLELDCERPVEFPLHLRVPAWSRGARAVVNGTAAVPGQAGELLTIRRRWKAGDTVVLELPMEITTSRWYAGSVAVERGPLVYALRIGERWARVEGDAIYGDWDECRPTSPWNYGLLEEDLPKLAELLEVEARDEIPVNPWSLETAPVVLRGRGQRIESWTLRNDTASPQPASPVPVPELRPEPITLIPYGATTLRIAAFPVVRQGKPPLAASARASASHVWSTDTAAAINDRLEPASSNDHSIPRLTWWDHRGTVEWAQLELDERARVEAVELYWFDDTGRGQCRTPSSWRLLHRSGDEWRPAVAKSAYGVAANRFNVVEIEPVETDALRVEVHLREGFSAGVLEWRVR